jgi:hypothetical protein
MAAENKTVQFNFYGLNIALHSSDAGVVDNIRRDFRYFENDSG